MASLTLNRPTLVQAL